ncbi:MAG: 4'-phosphopantetheinyl transferase superfamily protein [Proteobacteria bacterium]|nr:4'-phosphopantetheinyl transferase superfamily protein [Pseudomonadota bacterium]
MTAVGESTAMGWQPVGLTQHADRACLAAPLDVWWWPERLLPPIAARRQRTDTLLRTLLAPYVGLPPAALRFGRETHGRPFLLHAGAPDFNLSDTAGGAVVAIAAQGRVGVDVECVERALPVARLAARWFAREEAQALQKLDAEPARCAFLRLWTAKEAACKATGSGIFGFLSAWRFEVDATDADPRLASLPADVGADTRWRFHRLDPSGSHTLVVALRDLSDPPRCFVVTG